MTPVVGVWVDDAFWFCTGPTERKAHNLGKLDRFSQTRWRFGA